MFSFDLRGLYCLPHCGCKLRPPHVYPPLIVVHRSTPTDLSGQAGLVGCILHGLLVQATASHRTTLDNQSGREVRTMAAHVRPKLAEEGIVKAYVEFETALHCQSLGFGFG